MKTQISDIIDGSQLKNRIFSHPKYKDFTLVQYVAFADKPAYFGFCDLKATNHIDRMVIAQKIQAENENGMIIELLGNHYELEKSTSTTGKTITYFGEISLADFQQLTGYSGCGTWEAKYFIRINSDCTCDVYSIARRNERSQWQGRTSNRIDTAYITIL